MTGYLDHNGLEFRPGKYKYVIKNSFENIEVDGHYLEGFILTGFVSKRNEQVYYALGDVARLTFGNMSRIGNDKIESVEKVDLAENAINVFEFNFK